MPILFLRVDLKLSSSQTSEKINQMPNFVLHIIRGFLSETGNHSELTVHGYERPCPSFSVELNFILSSAIITAPSAVRFSSSL